MNSAVVDYKVVSKTKLVLPGGGWFGQRLLVDHANVPCPECGRADQLGVHAIYPDGSEKSFDVCIYCGSVSEIELIETEAENSTD